MKTMADLFDVENKIANLEDEANDIREEIGLNDMEYMDHVQGTNCAEYRCKKCREVWTGAMKLPCPNCYPGRSC